MEDYKEKLRLAREALDSSSYDKETIEYIFPELKESEDEKIRKSIIELVKQSSHILNSMNQKSMIDWLEKQGEQKPNFCHHVVDLSDCSEEYRKAYYDGWNNCNQQYSQLRADQKPTWSEEDDTYLHCLEYTVKHYFDDKDTINKCCSWLKSLKERMKGE